MIIRRTQNKFGIKKDGAWQKKQFSIWEFFLLLLSKAPYIVLAALLGAGLSLCYFKMMVPPRYTATAKLYITGQETLNLKLLSIRTGTLLTVDYQEVFKTWEVQENAADFHGSESQLLRPEQVEVSNPVGTRVLYISYTSEDPNAAAEAANAYAQAGREFMFAAMDIPQPVLFSAAVPPGESSGMGQKGFAAIRIENCFDGELKFEKGLPVTTKKDVLYHGFGVKSIQNAAAKYGGTATITTREGWFELRVLIPLGQPQQE